MGTDSFSQLNTSRIGKEFFNTTSSNSSNSVVSFFDDIINDVQGEINDKINDVAQDLGLHVSSNQNLSKLASQTSH